MTHLLIRARLTLDDVVELDDFLKRPDPPDLPRRGHRVTCEGRPDRYIGIVALMVRAAQWRHVAQEWVPTTGPARAPRAEWVQ